MARRKQHELAGLLRDQPLGDVRYLKVPKELADKLEAEAVDRHITGRARWAICARMILEEGVGK